MIDYNDLINRIESMQDLPVSEEMLGAYTEGNLSYSEICNMETIIHKNSYLEEIVNSNYELDDDMKVNDISNDSIYDDLRLPAIPDDSFIELDLVHPSSSTDTEDFDYAACADDIDYSQLDSGIDNSIENPFEEDDTSFDSSDNNNMTDYE